MQVFWQNIANGATKWFPYRRIHAGGNNKVRVRFAPSPTGSLHFGGLRTALYNYLFAKSMNGSFVLRIEDTDRTRYVPGAEGKLQEILEWVGLRPDEGPFDGGGYGPYVQSQRLPTYHKYVELLLERERAYRCFCTEKRLDLLRKDAVRLGQIPKYDNRCRQLSPAIVQARLDQNVPHVIRFKMDSFPRPLNDLVYGSILHSPTDAEGDPILIKSDGFPTYHFANVVDDHLMEISHVLRGVEWHISTPKHILLYEAFGWEPPEFAHLPLIMNSDGSKLSKRQGDVNVEHFKSLGYFPEAILNFAIQMGGGFGKIHNELYSIEELISKFSLSKMNTNSCHMDLNRLAECNRLAIDHHLRTNEGVATIVSATRRFVLAEFQNRLGSSALVDLNDAYIEKIIRLFKARITHLKQLSSDEVSYVWVQPTYIDHLNCEDLPVEFISDVLQDLDALAADSFTKVHILSILHNFSKKRPVRFGILMKSIRYALTGCAEGPAVADMLEVLGKEASIKRIGLAIHCLSRTS